MSSPYFSIRSVFVCSGQFKMSQLSDLDKPFLSCVVHEGLNLFLIPRTYTPRVPGADRVRDSSGDRSRSQPATAGQTDRRSRRTSGGTAQEHSTAGAHRSAQERRRTSARYQIPCSNRTPQKAAEKAAGHTMPTGYGLHNTVILSCDNMTV